MAISGPAPRCATRHAPISLSVHLPARSRPTRYWRFIRRKWCCVSPAVRRPRRHGLRRPNEASRGSIACEPARNLSAAKRRRPRANERVAGPRGEIARLVLAGAGPPGLDKPWRYRHKRAVPERNPSTSLGVVCLVRRGNFRFDRAARLDTRLHRQAKPKVK
jgi:hypothetical protein